MAHILIVDDLEQNLYLLEVLLKGHGYAVETAVNGTSALQKAKANPPSMIISDILMPVMDGFTLCRQWKADNQLKHIPFIFYTATYTDPQDRAFALSLGADKFLIKPLEPEQLIAVLHEIEQEQEQEPQGASPKPVVEETTYFKQYNETLIRKLEKKMMDLERANRRLQTLYQVSMKLAAIQPQKDLISQALKAVVEIVGYTYAEFFAYDAQTKIFTLQVAVGQDQETQADAACGQERNLVGLSEQQREPLIITDARIDPRWIPENIPVQSLLSVPVIYKERFIGLISFLSAKRDAFTEEDGRNAMTLANNIAVAI